MLRLAGEDVIFLGTVLKGQGMNNNLNLTPSQEEHNSKSLEAEKRSPEMPSLGGPSSGLPRFGGAEVICSGDQTLEAARLTVQLNQMLLAVYIRCWERSARQFS